MNKPERPNIIIPESFAENGVKTDFDSNKILNCFDRIQPDVLAGDNLNKFIDDTYKGLNYALSFGDYIENKVSKSGDTMTGGLTFKKSDTLDFTNTNNTVYTEAGNISFKDKNDNVCGEIRNYFNEHNNLCTSIAAKRSVNGVIKTSQIQIYVDKDGNLIATAPTPPTTDSSTKIATTEFCDGVTTTKATTLMTDTTMTKDTWKNFDLSSYLPNDNNKYEILCSCVAQCSNNAQCAMYIKSDLLTNQICLFRGQDQMLLGGNVKLLVGTGRTVSLLDSGGNSTHVGLYVMSYRKVR